MSKSLLSAFNIDIRKSRGINKKDYDVFTNKDLLDRFRISILENLSDRVDVDNLDKDALIEEVKVALEGYEVSNE